mmetsp:Transcript_120487/g.348240  ORF Transcript_120487/g.348240 Transcript_120487/m.348240 type:complete len:213 (+) Transcript_120487:1771-2409(+)
MSTCKRQAAWCNAAAPLESCRFGSALPSRRAFADSSSPCMTMFIRAVMPSNAGPFGSAFRPLGREPLWNSPARSCFAPRAHKLPGAIGEAYCCNNTVARMSKSDMRWTWKTNSSPNSLRNSWSMMYPTFSLAAQRKRLPIHQSPSSQCFSKQFKTVSFCMKAPNRRGVHFPKGIQPLSRNGSAPRSTKASMDFAACAPSTVGGVIAKQIRAV